MKGIELPINILVVVAVAIIVLLGVVALFFSTWFTGTSTMDLSQVTNRACNALRGRCVEDGVTPSQILLAQTYQDPAGTHVSASLRDLCEWEYNIAAADADTNLCYVVACGANCPT